MGASIGRIVLAALGLLVVIAVAFWAGRTVVEPPLTAVPEPRPSTYRARQGTISDTQPFTVDARWAQVGSIASGGAGTVTSISPAGVVRTGDVVALIDERPVVVVDSEVPFFREMMPGTRGRDVEAFQRHLVREAHFEGDPDGVFGSVTADAVRSWQRALGMAEDGVVALGDVTAIPADEVRVRPSSTVGDLVGPGDPLAELLSPRPEFEIVEQGDQVGDLVTGAEVEITGPRARWPGAIGTITTAENEFVRIEVTAPGGGAPCGRCADVPIVGTARYPAVVSIVPEVSGIVVPTSAIESLPDGSTAVVDASGTEVSVVVVQATDGLAVVEGIEEGTEVMLPGPDS